MITSKRIRFFIPSLGAALLIAMFIDFQPAFSQTQRTSSSGHTLAQKLVESTQAQHPEVNELGISVMTSQGCRNIASTDRSDIGEKCESEDLKPIRTGKPVVGKENGGYDISMPLEDSSGKLIGTVGIEFKAASGQTQTSAMQQAKKIADEMKGQIPSKATLQSNSK